MTDGPRTQPGKQPGKQPGRGELALYAVVRTLVVVFCRLFWRETVEGREHVPRSGPYIVAPVHRSNVDTPLAAIVTRRRLRYMGKESVWKIKPIGAFLSALGGFPVRREVADREALRRCVEVLEGGEPLVLFPEGRRRAGPVVEDLFEGAAYLALRTGVPIVPVGIGGSERAMPKGARMLHPVKVHVVIGPPLQPERPPGGRAPRRAVRELTDALQAELQRLFDEAHKKAGATAG